MSGQIGQPFHMVEAGALDVLASRQTPLILAVNDPPWAALSAAVAASSDVLTVVQAWDMDLAYLQALAARLATELPADGRAQATVVGLGGGTALDTAKFLAWQLGRPLVQIPTITSVDAGFTDAIGIRDQGTVRYVGTITPEVVVLDIDLIRSAPQRLNRAGIGDILSCHTGLYDWRLAAAHGDGVPWDESLAELGRTLLDELDTAADEVGAVSADGVRFLANAYQRIGAACAAAGHSRFEEGSEHFWAYAYEHATGAHLVHGELIAFAVCAMSQLQGNDPQRCHRIVSRAKARAHPSDLGITAEAFRSTVEAMRAFGRHVGLDHSVVDYHDVSTSAIDAAWRFACTVPREEP